MTFKKKILVIFFIIFAGFTAYSSASEIAFVEGNGDHLVQNLSSWRARNPAAVVTNINVENYEKQIKTKKGLQRVFVTRGLYLYYYIDKHNILKDRQKSVPEVSSIAGGIVFVRGYGASLIKNLANWRSANSGLSIVATGIELSTDQYRTDDGIQDLIMPRGMWLFYTDSFYLPGEQVSTDNYVHPVRPGIVFIEGAGALLQDRLSRWKESNPQLSIKTSSVEDFTDQIWTEDGYKRMVVARGLWIFYELAQSLGRDKSRSEVPYDIAEDYLKKAIPLVIVTANKDVVQDPLSRPTLQDALYWYTEVITDYPGDPVAAAAELRKLQVRLLLGEPVSSDMLTELFAKYKESSSETIVLYDLIDIYKKKRDLVKQLLLYQRVVKICKENPYSKETYEAVKAIEKINNEIEILKNAIH